jgi:hypothetical protein
MGSKRFLALTLAIVVGVITYCAQSCFELEIAKPICPQHHTSDCCKHDAPASGTLQRVAVYMPDTSRILLLATLPAVQFATQALPDWDLHHLPTVEGAGSGHSFARSVVLRI